MCMNITDGVSKLSVYVCMLTKVGKYLKRKKNCILKKDKVKWRKERTC